MKNKNNKLVFFLAFLVAFSIPYIGGKTLSVADNEIDLGVYTSEIERVEVAPFNIWGNSGWASLAASKPWCSGSGTQNDPYIIDGIYINGQGYQNYLLIQYTGVYFVIKNSVINKCGIRLISVRNGVIENNSVSNGNNGIYIDKNSKDNTIIGNEIFSNHQGIHCYGDNNIISQNLIRDNYLGVRFYWADYTFFTENLIYNSTGTGVIFSYGNYNIIKGNKFIDNGNPVNAYVSEGLDLGYETGDNIIYQNFFSGNLGVNARDWSGNNYWDNGSIGNYWDDYPGADLDGNGIGDMPYLITSVYGSVDRFPIYEGKIISPPGEFLEHLINYLEHVYHYRVRAPEIREEAEQSLEQSIGFLLQSKDKFELGFFYDAFDKIRDSIEFLIVAGGFGVQTQMTVDCLIFLVKFIVEDVMGETIEIVGEDDRFIIKAINHYDTALLMLEIENYGGAVRFFKHSYRNIMKARGELIGESFVDDLLDQLEKIQELKTGNIPNEALNYLEQAENKLMLAIEKANASLLSQSLYQLKDVAKNLLDTEKFGVETINIIESILQNADDVTYLKIVEAESILMGESNMHIDKAWIKYNKAIELWVSGKYEFALSYYAKAIEKVRDALN